MTADREIISSATARTDTGSARIEPANAPGVEGLLGLAVAVVVVAGLFFAKDVLIPITLAILLSFVLSPTANPQGVGGACSRHCSAGPDRWRRHACRVSSGLALC